MTLYLQRNGTIGTTIESPISYQFNLAKTVWVLISNGSQVPVTLQVQGGTNLYPNETILEGQPFAKQINGKLFTISGVGAVVNVKIQDEPPSEGQVQRVSQASTSSLGSNYQIIEFSTGAGDQTGFLTVPPGQKWRILSAQIRLTTGPITGNRRALAILVPGGNLVAGQLLAGPLIADTGTQTTINSFFAGTSGPTPAGETWDTLSSTLIAPTLHTVWNCILEAVDGDQIWLVMIAQGGDTAELNLSLAIEAL